VNRNLIRLVLVLGSAVLVASCASSRLHQQGLSDIEQGRYEIGLQKLHEALSSDPGNLVYKLDLKSRQEEAVQKLIAEADRARSVGQADVAEASYKRVLSIESGNDRARRGLEGVEADRRHSQLVAEAQQDLKTGAYEQADNRLRSVLSEDPGYAPATALRARIDQARGPTTVTPRLRTRDNRPVTLQFRDASTKMVFEVLSRQTGINFIFDKDVKSEGKTTIFVQDVPIEQAIDLVLGQNQLARQVLSENMALIYPNTTAKQKDYQDQIVKTFYLNTAAPKDIESLLKTVLDAKTLVINERANAVVMRDTPETVRMAEKLVASVDIAEPEVMMEVEVLEISRSRLQQLGISYPTSATLAPTALSGGKSMVLNDLKNQNGNTITISNLGVTVDALKQVSVGNVLASPRIRARNKEKAKILIGTREPVITTAASSSGTGGVISNTSVQYLDVGLTLDVEPTIYADNDVAIKMSLEVSSITKQLSVPTGNGGTTIAYEIGTRNASTLLQLKDGETQILAGLIQDSDTRSSSRIPGLGDLPVLGRLFSDHNDNKAKTEIVLSITPRIIRAKPRPSSDTTEFWYGTETRSGMAPLGAASSPPAMNNMGAGNAGMGSAPASMAAGTRPAAQAASGPVDVSTTGSDTVVGAPAAAPSNAATAAAVQASPQSRFQRFRGATGVSPTPPADGSAPAAKLTATIAGPAEVKVGDEFSVTVQLQGDQSAGRLRAQLRFDVSTFQFLSGDPGQLVQSAEGAKVAAYAGGVQMDATAPAGQPFATSGDLMVLKFKALKARPQTAFAGLVTAANEAGVSTGSSSPDPLTLAVTGN
jgi:general secretion pathway protein D